MSASEDELGSLHALVARELAAKIASGEATASDFSNAIKLLKDNNITCEVSAGNDLDKLQKTLERGSKPAVTKADMTDLEAAIENVEFMQGSVN